MVAFFVVDLDSSLGKTESAVCVEKLLTEELRSAIYNTQPFFFKYNMRHNSSVQLKGWAASFLGGAWA